MMRIYVEFKFVKLFIHISIRKLVCSKRGIKTLSLFFIDEVVKYKNYEAKDDKGSYALIFEEEYENIVRDRLVDTMLDQDYKNYLKRELNSIDKVHAGYFSVDKKEK